MVARHKRLGWRLAASLGVAAMVVAACGPSQQQAEPGDTASPADAATGTATGTGTAPAGGGDYCEGSTGGTLLWAHEQEPGDLHLDDPNNNLSITSWVRQAMNEGLHGVSAEIQFYPELLAEEVEVVDNGDDTFTYNHVLRDGLTWSDGTPFTSEHVQGTFDIIMEGFDYEAYNDDDPETDPAANAVYLIGSRLGYEQILPDSWELTSDTEFSYTTQGFFAGYPALFSEVYPTHIMTTAEEANEFLREWQDAEGNVLPSTGPMIYDGREVGVSMSMVRNDDYHGASPNNPDAQNTEGIACVDSVQINWVADTGSQINALRTGESDIIFTQPQLEFLEIVEDQNFTVASEAGPVWEHWGFNMYNVHLADPLVREAVALAMNKPVVMETLYIPLFGDLLPVEGLGNAYWMSNQEPYIDHTSEAGYGQGNVEEARARLEEAGYVDEGGVYTHPERGPLTLRVGTTGGNAVREQQQQILQAGYGEAGIEIVIDNVPGADYFSERPFSEEHIACITSLGEEGNCETWELTQFAWVGSAWPGGQTSSFLTASGNNPYGYANDEFDARARECDATVDDAERAACYNELSQYVTTLEIDPEGLAVMPITQKPSFYAYSNQSLSKAAVAPDNNFSGPLLNVYDYVKN